MLFVCLFCMCLCVHVCTCVGVMYDRRCFFSQWVRVFHFVSIILFNEISIVMADICVRVFLLLSRIKLLELNHIISYHLPYFWLLCAEFNRCIETIWILLCILTRTTTFKILCRMRQNPKFSETNEWYELNLFLIKKKKKKTKFVWNHHQTNQKSKPYTHTHIHIEMFVCLQPSILSADLVDWTRWSWRSLISIIHITCTIKYCSAWFWCHIYTHAHTNTYRWGKNTSWENLNFWNEMNEHSQTANNSDFVSRKYITLHRFVFSPPFFFLLS